MGSSTVPAITPKTRYALTLTSGTSWTVPAGVFYVNVTLQGGGAGGFGGTVAPTYDGRPGQMVSSTLATTPGASITYAIGAGGTAGNGSSTQSGAGGTTTFTGATSAVGGAGSSGTTGTSQGGFYNGAPPTAVAGGSGRIDVEYWV